MPYLFLYPESYIAQTACVCTIQIRHSVINNEYTHGKKKKKSSKSVSSDKYEIRLLDDNFYKIFFSTYEKKNSILIAFFLI